MPRPGGADALLAEEALAHLVQGAVVRGDDVRVGRDEQPRAVDAAGGQAVDLLEQHLGVDDDAVADDRHDARAEDARGQQVQRVLLVADDHRVAGVVAAVELDDVVDAGAEGVGRLALALVTPLGTDQHDCGHAGSSSVVVLGGEGDRAVPRRPEQASAGRQRPGRSRPAQLGGQPGPGQPRGLDPGALAPGVAAHPDRAVGGEREVRGGPVARRAGQGPAVGAGPLRLGQAAAEHPRQLRDDVRDGRGAGRRGGWPRRPAWCGRRGRGRRPRGGGRRRRPSPRPAEPSTKTPSISGQQRSVQAA